MNKRNVFPIGLYASDKYGWADCPALAKLIWGRKLKEHLGDRTYYATDCVITSGTTVQLKVYDIASNYSGGIGKKFLEIEITDLTPEEIELVNVQVFDRQVSIATSEFEVRETVKRNAAIMVIHKDLFGV